MANIEQLSATVYVNTLLKCADKTDIRTLNERDHYLHAHTYLGQRDVAVFAIKHEMNADKTPFAFKYLCKIINFAILAQALADRKTSRKVFDALCEVTKIISSDIDYFKDSTYFDHLTTKADRGHHFACHFLAMHYVGGKTPEGIDDNDKAIHYFTKAATGSFPTSQDFINQLEKETEPSA